MPVTHEEETVEVEQHGNFLPCQIPSLVPSPPP